MNFCFITILLLVYFMWKFVQRKWKLPLTDLCKKFVLITGCDSGFGHCLALHLDSIGIHVIATCLTSEGREELEKKGSQRMTVLQMDVTNGEQVREVRKQVQGILPQSTGLWGLVNNAGILGPLVPIWSTVNDYRAVMEVNLFGMVQVTDEFLPLVRKPGGRIINVASVMRRLSFSGGPYIASKHAVAVYSDGLRIGLKEFGITVHMIEPGGFPTPFLKFNNILPSLDRQWQNMSEERKDFFGEEHAERKNKLVVDSIPKMLALTKFNKIEHVVEAMTHALTSRFPSTKYLVGWDAKFFYIPLSMLPDCLMDYVSIKLV